MKLDLSSLRRSVYSLEKALQITEAKLDDETVSSDEIELIKAGVIQNFAFAYELCWKFMKRWIQNNMGAEMVDGVTRKELFRLSVESRLIVDVDTWVGTSRVSCFIISLLPWGGNLGA